MRPTCPWDFATDPSRQGDGRARPSFALDLAAPLPAGAPEVTQNSRLFPFWTCPRFTSDGTFGTVTVRSERPIVRCCSPHERPPKPNDGSGGDHVRTSEGSVPRHLGSTVPMKMMRTGRGSAGTGGPPRPVIPRQGDDRVDGVGSAQELWDALTRARAEYAPLVLAAAEEAVFRFYLPLAQTLASTVAPRGVDRVEAEQAADVALAQAVLGWQDGAREGFDAFARAAIESQLRFLAAVQGLIWRGRSQGGGQPATRAQPPSARTQREPIPRPSGRGEIIAPGS